MNAFDGCTCATCQRVRLSVLLARAEREPRPEYWRARPGTKKAIERTYGPKTRRKSA